jgi:hypothetical protein
MLIDTARVNANFSTFGLQAFHTINSTPAKSSNPDNEFLQHQGPAANHGKTLEQILTRVCEKSPAALRRRMLRRAEALEHGLDERRSRGPIKCYCQLNRTGLRASSDDSTGVAALNHVPWSTH